MTQRTLAAVIAVPLVLGLLVLSWVVPLPFTIYSPGPTVDVLGEFEDEPIVQVEGHKTYPVSGELRLTTVSETTREADLDLWTLMGAWVDSDSAVVPFEVAHPDESLTAEDERQQGHAQMVSSQEGAVAAAFTELGYDVSQASVASVEKGSPADGVLRTDDAILRVGKTAVSTPEEVVAAVQQAEPGEPLSMRIERNGQRRTVTPTPGAEDGKAHLGIAVGATYDFPFEVELRVNPDIGGPSAGMMMATSVYDVLTPGSLTGGRHVAGTGTITVEGDVGRIGGIRQKIAGAENDGAELFLVPQGNCADVEGVDPGDMRLARVATLTDSIEVVGTFAKDADAELPTCGDGAEAE